MSDQFGAGTLAAHTPAKNRRLPRVGAALTPAELRVMQLAIGGHSTPEIAGSLGKSEKTIKTQLSSIYRKLGAANRAHAVAIYLDKLHRSADRQPS